MIFKFTGISLKMELTSTKDFYNKVENKMYLMCRLCFTDDGFVEPIFKIEESLTETIKNILPFKVRF